MQQQQEEEEVVFAVEACCSNAKAQEYLGYPLPLNLTARKIY